MHNEPGCILKQRIPVRKIKIFSFKFFFINIFRQDEWLGIAFLVANKIGDPVHLRCVDKCTLKPNYFAIVADQHIALANQLFGAAYVGATYGLANRSLGAVGLLGPLRMDYEKAIRSVRAAAFELSRLVDDVYGSQ